MESSETSATNVGDHNVGNQNSYLSTVDNSDLFSVDKFSLVPVNSEETFCAGQDLSTLSTSTSASTVPSFGIPAVFVGTSTTNVTETGSTTTMEPFKRPEKLKAPVNLPPVTPRPDRPGRMTNQLKFLQSVLCQSLWRSRISWAFQLPVDPVALNCLDYYEIIKNPMDLGTIKQRLLNQFYWSAQECLDDFNLMFENCRSYNNPGDPVVRDCNELNKVLREKIMQMPSVEMELERGNKNAYAKKNVGPKKKDATRMSTAVVSFKSEPISQAISLPGNKCVKRKADTTTSAYYNQDYHLGVGGPIRQQAGQVALHRQEVPKDQGAGRRTRPRLTGELRQCKEILKELMSRKHQAIAYYFYEPVDPVKHEAPGYFDVIKNPMDLGTVQKKLDEGLYKTCAEFAADVSLIFTNCLTYNQQDRVLRQAAQQMQVVFENRFAAMIDESGESEAFEHEEVRKTKREHSSSESEDNSEEERKNKILLLQTQMAAVNQQLADLQAEGARKAFEKFNQRRRKRQANAPSSLMKQTSRGNKRPKNDSSSRFGLSRQGVQRDSARASESVDLPMDTQELQDLSRQMLKLPPPAHDEVYRIMQSMEPVEGGNKTTEFVVDFENLQPRTIRALQAYVTDFFERRAQAYASDRGRGVESAGEMKSPQNSQESSESASSSSSSSDDSSSDSSEDEDRDDKGENEIRENPNNPHEASSSHGYNLKQPSYPDGTQQQQQVFFSNDRKLSVPMVETQSQSLPLPYDIQKQSFHRGHTETLSLLQEQVQKPSIHLRDDQQQPRHEKVEIQQHSDRGNEPLKPYPSHVPELTKNAPYATEQQRKPVPMTQTHFMTPIMRQEQHQTFLARCPQKEFALPYAYDSRNSYAPAQELVSVIPKALPVPPVVGLPLDTIKAKQEYQKQQDDKRKHDQEMEKRRIQAELDAQARLAEERRKYNQQVAMPRPQMIPRASEKLFTMKPLPTPLRNEQVAKPGIVQVVAADGNTPGKLDAERQKMREEEQRRRKQAASQIDLNYQSELLRQFECGELDGLI